MKQRRGKCYETKNENKRNRKHYGKKLKTRKKNWNKKKQMKN